MWRAGVARARPTETFGTARRDVTQASNEVEVSADSGRALLVGELDKVPEAVGGRPFAAS